MPQKDAEGGRRESQHNEKRECPGKKGAHLKRRLEELGARGKRE
jgi:hypothetical protein